MKRYCTTGTLLSVLTLTNVYLMGTKTLWGPVTGVLFQIPWFYFAWKNDKGLIPGTIALVCVQAYNLYKWW